MVFFEPSNYQVYLYSDGNNKNLENNYLSAILDLKISYPNVVNQMHVEETTASGLRQKDIGEYPTLVIIKDGVTIEKLSGENHKKKILNRLEETLLSVEKTTYISSSN